MNSSLKLNYYHMHLYYLQCPFMWITLNVYVGIGRKCHAVLNFLF